MFSLKISGTESPLYELHVQIPFVPQPTDTQSLARDTP